MMQSRSGDFLKPGRSLDCFCPKISDAKRDPCDEIQMTGLDVDDGIVRNLTLQSDGRKDGRLPYRPEIDGMRAFAVVPVVLFHFKLKVPGGFVGVDVFFVISGFLITSILIADISPRSVVDFWIRRIRRLFPSLAVLIVTVCVIGRFVLPAVTYRSLGPQALAVLLSASNVYYYWTADYFSSTLEFPFLHCWSLAVEEQFYLVYPCLLLLIHAIESRYMTSCRMVFLLSVFLVSLIASIVVTRNYREFAFYLLPTRIWELALGGIISFLPSPSCLPRVMCEVLSWCGAVAIAVSYTCFTSYIAYPSYRALLPCAGCALFLASQRDLMTSCGRVFAAPCLTFFGKRSYSLYLWHWPIYVFLSYHTSNSELDVTSSLVGVSLSLFASLLNFRLIETPCRSEVTVSVHRLLFISTCTWLALVLSSFGMWHIGLDKTLDVPPHPTHEFGLNACGSFESEWDTRFGHPSRKCLLYISEGRLSSMHSVNTSRVHESTIITSQAFGPIQKNFSGAYKLEEWEPIIIGTNDSDMTDVYPSVAFIGSSHCVMYGPLLEGLAKEYKVKIGLMCRNHYLGSIQNPLSEFDIKRIDYFITWNVTLVVWIDFWNVNDWLAVGQLNLMTYDWCYGLGALAAHSKRVVVLGDVPFLPGGISSDNNFLKHALIQQKKRMGNWSFLKHFREDADCGPVRLSIEEKIQRAILECNLPAAVDFFKVDMYFRDMESHELQFVHSCTGKLLYHDRDHLNIDGAVRLEQLFRREVFGQNACE